MNEVSGADTSRLTILSVAYPLMTIGRGAAGGSEEILRLMDREMTRRGFRSIVIAADGSCLNGELIATAAMNGSISDQMRAAAQQLQQEAIQSVLARMPVDLIHFHGLDFLAYRPARCSVPQLATLHLPVSWYPADLFEHDQMNFNFVSESQARSAPVRSAIPVVSNGIDLEQLYLSTEKDSYLLWLGRICPEKGTHIALEVARRLDLPLVIAGPLHPFPSHLDYYADQVRPYLDDRRTYVGPVNGADKARLLSRARCLLVPSLVEETSSLVAMEAIASGTPVVAFRSGALPEVVDHAVTGFVVDSADQMAAAVSLTHQISPSDCRAVAERRFSSVRMADEYITLYRRLVSSASVHAR